MVFIFSLQGSSLILGWVQSCSH